MRDIAAESTVEEVAALDARPAAAEAVVTAEREHAVVAVVGLGYVGLPTAIALRDAGCRIVGLDSSNQRLTQIRDGEVELLESERESLREHLGGDGFVLTDRSEALNAADLVLICVPTPIDEHRLPDPRALRAACASVVRHARPEQTIVLTSTTYVGCTRELLVEPLAERGLRVGEDVFVAFAPERIDPGVDEHSQTGTPRVLGGVSETCFRRAAAVLRHTCAELHRVSSPEAAEMVKLYENTFRAVNIALAFEIAEACHDHGLDPIEVTEGAATKPYGFLAHYPSAGVGGHCIGVDPYYLVHPMRQLGRPASVAEQGLRKLAGRPRHIVWRAHETLVEAGQSLSGARVLVVGASYKPGVADAREAPAREIVARLRQEGAEVDFHDPLVPTMRLDGEQELHSVCPDPREDASGLGPEDYQLAIVITVHPGHDYGWLQRCPTVLDCTYRAHAGRRRLVP
ncbi:MAG TPA: nucleotide sugar dehydrogenase [Solirubrobacteraceae bacterium]|nr:nucleotide sugar dehydrogenase [Solirubrobacteraceae bacterium]